jgi:molybdopterin molybdotransferase
MIRVEEAEHIILTYTKDFGTEQVSFESSLGRVLAEDIKADRDIPPYDRATMDGVAISYDAFQNGIRSFKIIATRAAGEPPLNSNQPDECIEIMTGAVVPPTTDTIIRYEDLAITNGTATVLTTDIKRGQNIHRKGKDKMEGEIVAAAYQFITPAHINIVTSVGAVNLSVKKLPKVVIISTGNELVDVQETPSPYEIRSSNSHVMKTVLQQYCLQADIIHVPDAFTIIKEQVQHCLEHYDVLLISGGVSMGKFDYLPRALEELAVEKLFHKVQQRPGKPFWFGQQKKGALVFAFPGNPVSSFMCLHRYFIPWLKRCLTNTEEKKWYAALSEDVMFDAPLQYFLPVKITVNNEALLVAAPVTGNGSGDYAHLSEADAFMELPLEQNIFKEREVFRIWPFKNFFL